MYGKKQESQLMRHIRAAREAGAEAEPSEASTATDDLDKLSDEELQQRIRAALMRRWGVRRSLLLSEARIGVPLATERQHIRAGERE